MAAAKSKAARKSPAKKKAARKSAAKKKSAKLDLSKYLGDLKIGNMSLDDVRQGGSKSIEAISDANRAIIDGYTDLAKQELEMLKALLDELKKVGDDKSDVVKELKRILDLAKKDVQALQKMAKKTNAEAKQIIKKRTDANTKAWKKLVADAKKSVAKKEPKKAAVKKKAAKKQAVKKKAASKAAPKKKAARKAAPKPAATPAE